MQAPLEAEMTEFLDRDCDQRDQQARPGYRNGHADLHVKTTAGPVVLERPSRSAPPGRCLAAAGQGVSRTNALKSLVLAG